MMTDLLRSWYVDSSPGGGAKLIEKCGNLKSASGLVGVSSYASPPAPPEADIDLGDTERALLEPGTVLSSGSGVQPDRTAAWAFASNGAVWFDGMSALYNLARGTKNGNLSLSYWYNPWDELASSFLGGASVMRGWMYNMQSHQDLIVLADQGTGPRPTWVNSTFHFGYFGLDQSVQAGCMLNSGPEDHIGEGDPYWNFSAVGYALFNGTWQAGEPDIGNFVTDPLDDMQGWMHVMMSVKVTGGVPKFTIWVDETEIATDVNQNFLDTALTYPLSDASGTGDLHNMTGETFSVRADKSDQFGLSPNHDGNSIYQTIGGGGVNFDTQSSLPLEAGDGMVGAVTELWIAQTHIDWSNPVERAKFHTSDIGNSHFAPVSLGKTGTRPGHTPLIYCTGSPEKFRVNRAIKRNQSVSRTSVGGTVGQLLPYGILPL